MVASIKPIQAVANSVSNYFEIQSDPGEYYGESAHSEWAGTGASLLGLEGRIARNCFENLLTGRDPSGHMLGNMRASNSASKNRRVPGYDITLSVPKSFSILWAIGTNAIRKTSEEILLTAARSTIQELETGVPLARRGRGGRDQIHADLVVGMFLHKLSRANEPQLHVHCVIANVCRGSDQQWRGVNSRKLHEYTMTLGSIFHGHLQKELTNRLVITLIPGQRRDGSQAEWSEIAQIPKSLIDRFSTRSKQIEARLDSASIGNASARQRANFATRTRKAEPKDLDELQLVWQSESKRHGLNPAAFCESIQGDNTPLTQGAQNRVLDRELHATPNIRKKQLPRTQPNTPEVDSSFEESPISIVDDKSSLAVVPTDSSQSPPKSACKQSRRGQTPTRFNLPAQTVSMANAQQYESCFVETASELAETRAYYSASQFAAAISNKLRRRGIYIPDLIHTVSEDLKTHESIVVLQGTSRPLYSSRSYFEKEQTLLDDAKSLRSQKGARVNASSAERLSLGNKSLNDEQAKAAFHLFTQSSAIRFLQAAAGSGEEKTLKAVCEGFKHKGYTVVGTALSGQATSNLGKKTGIETRTLASWLYHLDRSEVEKTLDVLRHEAKMLGRAFIGKGRWERNKIQLPRHGVIVLDQAGMIDTHGMSRLLHHARNANCTVILCGDTNQLQPIGVGGPFKYLRDTVGYAELKEHQRQESPADRFAVDSLRDGRSHDAIESYIRRGKFQSSEDPVSNLVQQWGESGASSKPEKHQVLVPTKELKDAVNKLCQAERKRRCSISGQGIRFGNARFFKGDRVRFRDPLFRHGITTGSSATVIGTNRFTRTLTVWLDEEPTEKSQELFGATRTISISLMDLEDNSIDLAYASTIHSAHGSECDHVWALVDGGHTTTELAYAQLSHGSKSTRLFATASDSHWEAGRIAEDWNRSERKNLAHDMMPYQDLQIEQ